MKLRLRFLLSIVRACQFALAFLLAPTFSGLGASAVGVPIHIYVSPTGQDKSFGRSPLSTGSNGPVKSLERARELARGLRTSGTTPNGIEIVLMNGVHRRTEPFLLGPEDSGTASSPLIIRGETPGKAILTGGREIHRIQKVIDSRSLDLFPVHARKHVWEFDLLQTSSPEGALIQRRGTGHRIPARMPELYVDGRPMTVSRWPMEGFATIQDVRRGGGGGKTSFRFSGAPHARWKQESNLWASGYWCWDWAFSSVPVENIESDGILTLGAPDPTYGIRSGQRANLLNALSELNHPGCYCVDTSRNKVYFWPPQAPPRIVEVSWVPSLVRANGVSWVELRNIQFLQCAATTIQFENAQDCRLVNCAVRGASGRALDLSGLRCTVIDSIFEDLGEGAILLSGGDQANLTPGGNRVQNNRLTRFNRLARTYAAAINIRGVGHQITQNLIQDGPHVGILFQGCDHVIEYNELSTLCNETSDSGAIYTGRDWTSLGTIIRFNYFHHIKGVGKVTPVIYLDDQASGTRIQGNLFYQVQEGIFIHAGSGNEVLNNLFVECNSSISVAGQPEDPAIMRQLTALSTKVSKPAFVQKYPLFEQILKDPHPGAPKGNRIDGNAFIKSQPPIFAGSLKSGQILGTNFTNLGINLFIHLPTRPTGPVDFRLKPDSGLPRSILEVPLRLMSIQNH